MVPQMIFIYVFGTEYKDASYNKDDFGNGYKHQFEEGNAITLQCYSLGEIQPKYCIVKKDI